MPNPVSLSKQDRISFSKLREVEDLPDLIEIQRKSYRDFLQRDVPPGERKNIGLQSVLREVFPITDFAEASSIDFIGYTLGAPKYDIEECQARGFSYAVPLKITFQLRHQNKEEQGPSEILESEVYMGEIPLMTEQGTFIINGSERVIVNQLHRSPSATFKEDTHSGGHKLLKAAIIPYRGAWIEFEFDIKDLIYVRLDRKKKMFATVLLRALGWETDEDILRLYVEETEEVPVGASLIGRISIGTLIDRETGEILYESCSEFSETDLEVLSQSGITSVEVLTPYDSEATRFLRNTIAKDRQSAPYTEGDIKDQALVEIFRKIQPGDPPTIESAKNRFEKLFFDPLRYDLADVGRYKLNQKFNHIASYYSELGKIGEPLPTDLKNNEGEVLALAGQEITEGLQQAAKEILPNEPYLRKEDITATLKHLLDVQNGVATLDDIDHLGNRRVRAVGELLMNQVRVGMLRVARATREKITVKQSKEGETMTPLDLVNPKPLSASLKDFFGSSQLSQFMQQINPLDELTHKRRLSALGPGGLHRERATYEVRDVHRTHYGRICPIETPEGPSVGLIVSLGTFARINDYGFLETPYRKVVDGQVSDQISYLTAEEEDRYTVAQANSNVDEESNLLPDGKGGTLMTRKRGDFTRVAPSDVDYIDVSPKQIVGVSAALIPFLEHDDANRALMGSNMQRQSVPLIKPESPYVGTGMEAKAARDSSAVVLAKNDGIVDRVSASEIIIRTDDTARVEGGEQSSSEMGYDIYRLQNFKRSNNDTCIHQKPLVSAGDHVETGQVIADGTSTEGGELALGNNALVAFLPWEGYNFEDAILISERLVKDDVYTSIHINEFEVEARETKMGREEITRDIPNLSEEALSKLDDEGIIQVGSKVEPGTILVGKVTPKGESDLGPEEKLLRAIFGEKVGEVKDASSYAKPGVEGTVIDVKVFSRKEKEKDRQTELRETSKIKEAELTCSRNCQLINQRKNQEIASILNGQVLVNNLRDGDKIIAKSGETLTDDLLLANRQVLDQVFVEDQDAMDQVQQIRQLAQVRINAHISERSERIQKVQKGDELKPGVIKLVKVYVATQRKISVGDKMAGRHGNKGVISKILPAEDMPYLADGTPIDIALNPLGVPSRMNVGQILETHLGWAVGKLGLKVATPVFDGATEEDIRDYLQKAKLPKTGKTTLYDGRTGEPFHQEATVGYSYMLKLNHLVDDKLHARSTGPYSLVTQQPLGGKAQQGGQRLGEMEVWALEAYGAAYTLQELLTVKSDDVNGRSKMYETIVKGQNAPPPGTPESFNVLVKELQSLGLDVSLDQTQPQITADPSN